MDAPFTASQFLDVFERYNAAVWPAQIAGHGLVLLMIYWVVRGADRRATPTPAGRPAGLRVMRVARQRHLEADESRGG